MWRGERFLQRLWYAKSLLRWLLFPLSLIFCSGVRLRRWLYRKEVFASRRIDAQVIVVGNISVGGTGKTPMVISLARLMQARGYKTGIVCRGYCGKSHHWPVLVTVTTPVNLVGDEATLLARKSGALVAAGPDRASSAKLLSDMDCSIIISDDGLQHYSLQRDIEIAMINTDTHAENALCLPAGPLREPVSRLQTVDFVVCSGKDVRSCAWRFDRKVASFWQLTAPENQVDFALFQGSSVHAVAGIAFPESFFVMLERAGLRVIRHPYPDHYWFCEADLLFDDDLPVLMTEKDAVKCLDFAHNRCWAANEAGEPDFGFIQALMARLGIT
ncbi:MAG: tetraacyldisaccharide 4'-kinase [Gammaproteobacteria bacterium]